MPVVDLLGLPYPQLATHLDAIGVGERHAGRVFKGLHRDLVALDAIEGLGRHAAVIGESGAVAAAEIERSVVDEQTEKLVLRLADGARIEAVLVPMPQDRVTLCVSTQVGCAMACAFCATGTLGLTRSLTAGEIVAQVHAARAWAKRQGRRIHRLVFMGMGEPLHAWPSTQRALEILIDPRGPCFGAENITVSTVGLPDRMRDFAAAFGGRVQLALSLHAGTDATRARIIPTARRAPIASLRALLQSWPLPGKRALMVEYVVLPGVNDSEEEIAGVAAFMEGLRGVVNLIPFNPFPGSAFRSPEPDEVMAVQRRLRAAGVMATVRWPRGRRAAGACGQLALAHERAESEATP
jgi:23S rRNA (adenine2503-C2)-methyltransferase